VLKLIYTQHILTEKFPERVSLDKKIKTFPYRKFHELTLYEATFKTAEERVIGKREQNGKVKVTL
jgi:hypothetical protein